MMSLSITSCLRNSSTTILLLATALLGSRSFGARPADPWPGPKGEYVFFEAEDMTLTGKGWEVENAASHVRDEGPSNLKSLAGDKTGKGEATQAVDIPADGTYQLWARYNHALSHDAKKRGPFQVVVAQQGKDAVTGEFDQTYDGPEGTKREPTKWRWEKISINLVRGPATIALRKSGPDKTAHGTRDVDCLLLTTDAAYQPDERDFAPQTYLRIRLIQADLPKLYFYGFIDHMHAPWYHNIAIGGGGMNSKGVVVKTGETMSAGQSSAWVNLSRLLYVDSDCDLTLMATLKYHNPDAANSRYAVDFATAPNHAAIVASFERNGPGCGMSIRIPPDMTQGRKPKFDLEVASENLHLVEQLTPVKFGKLPDRFPILIGLSMHDGNTSAGTREREVKVARLLGCNGTSGRLEPTDVPAGLHWGRAGARVMVFGPGGYDEPELDRIKGYVNQSGKELTDNPLRSHYIATQLTDEAAPPALATMVGQTAHEAAFLRWLREQGRTLKDLMVDDWKDVKLTADRAGPNPVLYVESERFRAWSIAHFFKQAGNLVHQAFPANALTSQNFSDGAVYYANFYAQGNDYFTWFRDQSLDLAWSEDWTNGSSTPQLCGWNVALLRAATREHGQPIGMYNIASHPTPLDVKLKAYSDLAQGAKILDIYSYTPPYQGHEGSWYFKAPTYAAIAELTREVGAAEDILLDAQPRPAETAIIYSRAADIWDVGVDDAMELERIHTWLALRHAQHAVDVLDEEDVAAGKLKGRRVAYLFGAQLDRRAMEPLAKWVQAGGTLVLAAGAGGRDEFNRVNATLDERLGLSRGPVEHLQKYLNASRYLTISLSPKGKVQILAGPDQAAATVDYFALREDLTAKQGDEPLATYSDGKPAALLHRTGDGRVVTVGYLPAISYVRGALIDRIARADEPVQPLACVAQAMTVQDSASATRATAFTRAKYSSAPAASAFDPALREFITRAAAMSDIHEPVEMNVPLVECTFMEGSAGWVVPLANYSGASIERMAVTLRVGDRPIGEVRSARQGVLKTEPVEKGVIKVTLPLESTDMIYAAWSRR